MTLQICAVYFTTIYWLARHISADSAPLTGLAKCKSQPRAASRRAAAAARSVYACTWHAWHQLMPLQDSNCT